MTIEAPATPEVKYLDIPEEAFDTLSVSQRKLGLRIVPFNVVAESKYGPILFEPGAFGEVDASRVRLRMDHEDPPTGLGETYQERRDAAYMQFGVSKTQRGDEQLTLARDGVSRGASVGFADGPSGPRFEQRDGRRVLVYGPDSARLLEVSTTWQPTFAEAGITYVLKKDEQEGEGPMAEATQEAPAVGAEVTTPTTPTITPGVDYDAIGAAVAKALSTAKSESRIEELLDKQAEIMELQRAQFSVPKGEPKKAKLAHWVEYSLRQMFGGDNVMSPTEIKQLALDDVVTGEQPGLVPSVFTADYDDLINQDRPFLSSTRQISPPQSGMTLTLPIIKSRAAAGTQAGGQKTEVTTTATKVTTGTFNYQSVLGGADISIQMINRAERGFFELITGDIAMAYAGDCEAKAVAALLAGYTPSGGSPLAPNDGGTIDPEDLALGAAWANSITTYKRAPDTIWLSSAAVSAFIDAKGPLTGAPLYSNLAAAFTAAGGPGGILSGLRPIYVPALDGTAVDVLVGPSRGFVWAEDPARTLRADNAALAGQDILLAGGIFPAPRFAHAFTKYVLPSS